LTTHVGLELHQRHCMHSLSHWLLYSLLLGYVTIFGPHTTEHVPECVITCAADISSLPASLLIRRYSVFRKYAVGIFSATECKLFVIYLCIVI